MTLQQALIGFQVALFCSVVAVAVAVVPTKRAKVDVYPLNTLTGFHSSI